MFRFCHLGFELDTTLEKKKRSKSAKDINGGVHGDDGSDGTLAIAGNIDNDASKRATLDIIVN